MTRPGSLTAVLLAVEEPAHVRTEARFGYRVEEPYTVRLQVPAGTGLMWLLARDLLFVGTQRSAGEGDVRVSPYETWMRRTVVVQLRDAVFGDGIQLHLPARELVAFLRSTYRLVPPGDESAYLNLDAALAWLTSIDGSGGTEI